MSTHPDELRRLRQLVTDHQVVFEIRQSSVGPDVVLYGTHGARYQHIRIPPGCELCQQVWDDLRDIATAALPRADVELVLEIRDRRDQMAASASCQERCRDEIIARLKALGVREATVARAV